MVDRQSGKDVRIRCENTVCRLRPLLRQSTWKLAKRGNLCRCEWIRFRQIEHVARQFLLQEPAERIRCREDSIGCPHRQQAIRIHSLKQNR